MIDVATPPVGSASLWLVLLAAVAVAALGVRAAMPWWRRDRAARGHAPPRDRPETAAVRRVLLGHLRDEEPDDGWDVDELRRRTGFSVVAIRRELSSLQQDGLVCSERRTTVTERYVHSRSVHWLTDLGRLPGRDGREAGPTGDVPGA